MKLIVDEFSARILSASLQGAVAIAAALLLVLLLPRLPVLLKVWAMRVALLKMHLAALFVGGIGLTLLAAPSGGTSGESNMFADMVSMLLPCALLFWTLSVSAGIYRHIRNRRHLQQVVLQSVPVTDENVLSLYRSLCRRLKVSNAPDLRAHRAVVSPMLIHHRKATIVLPLASISSQGTVQIEAALAHELAHHVHADLRWAWLIASTDLLFFFHPMVWFALKKLRLFEECAADAKAMAATEATPSTYSRTLLTFVEEGFLVTGACAMADSAIELDRRIKALYNGRKQPTRAYKLVAVVALITAAATLLPWSLQAPQDKPAGPVSPAMSRGPSSGAPIAAPMNLAL